MSADGSLIAVGATDYYLNGPGDITIFNSCGVAAEVSPNIDTVSFDFECNSAEQPEH